MMVFSVISLLVGALGVVAIAANSVAGNLNWFTFVFPMALGSAASIRVGNYVGAGDYAGARAVAKLAIQLALGYAVLASLILLIGRNLLPLIYTQDQAVVVLTAQVLIVVAAYQLFDCLQAAIIGALGIQGHAISNVVVDFGLLAGRVAGGYVLGRGIVGFDLGLPGFLWDSGLGCSWWPWWQPGVSTE